VRLASGRLLAILVLSGIVVLVGVYGASFARNTYLEQASARGEVTLRLAVAALRGHLSRYEALPALIADNADIRSLVLNPGDPRQRDWGNAYLEEINDLLESSDIYVMMPNGETIAASNYRGPASFVGGNFSFRPYFQDAMAGERGRFFALGTTSLKRGYYFSAPIDVDGVIRGVVVFKIDVDDIEASWRGGDHQVIVTDPEGIIFMTDRPDWLYASVLPLTAERIARTEAHRRYANAEIRELSVTRGSFAFDRELMTIPVGNREKEFLVVEEQMPEAGWTVKVLLDTSSARAQASAAVALALMLIGLAGLIGYAIMQRRARLRERLELQRLAQEQLEGRVAERTAELATANRLLESEVRERRSTEQQLRRTQADLVQAGKLAALGQMSAALSHEFNQPLAAVRAYAENASAFLERGRSEKARDNLDRISGLTERMASISRHLRNFARKPNQKLEPVLLAAVVAEAMEIVGWRLRAADADVRIVLAEPDLVVRACPIRLQQVLINLLSNAADAVDGASDRRIEIGGERRGQRVAISIRDRGRGVPDAIRERIFDPFFTTKGVGKGLGLGLSISYNILKDFGGDLVVANHPEGGAVFTIELNPARMPVREAAE
jgi:two-component system C4-dicarboxylate transport sensor histidine kinase DctB